MCRVERARIGVCCRILPARGLWRALHVVLPCRAPVNRAAYFAAISFPVRRVPSKAIPEIGSGNVCSVYHALDLIPSPLMFFILFFPAPSTASFSTHVPAAAQESESVAGYCLQGAYGGSIQLFLPAARPQAERRTLQIFLSMYAASPQRQCL